MIEFELVLPCYNEGKTLERLLKEVVRSAESFGYGSDRFQLVLVQNGSIDDTPSEIERLKKIYGHFFRTVTIPVNRGYGYGLWKGLQSTNAPLVGWSHADLQCSPKDAFRALERVKERGERIVVRGFRTDRALKDRMVSWVFASISSLVLGVHAREINAQPKVFPRELLAEIKDPPLDFGFDLYALYSARRAGYVEEFIEVSFPPRIHGVSNWAGSLMQRHKTIRGIIRFMWRVMKSEGRLG